MKYLAAFFLGVTCTLYVGGIVALAATDHPATYFYILGFGLGGLFGLSLARLGATE